MNLKLTVLLAASAFLGAASAGFINPDSFDHIAQKVNSLQTTWKAENQFGPEVTVSSFRRYLGALDSEVKLPALEQSNSARGPLPEEFDAREAWPDCPTISHIRDQGNCGSCWAVAGAGAMSDRLCIASNGTFREALSAEELVSCCEYCGKGCQGGYPPQAWLFAVSHGLVTGGDYNSNQGCQPYSIEACEHHVKGPLPPCDSLPMSNTPECKTKCTNPDYSSSYRQDHHKARRAFSLPSYSFSEEDVRREIMNHGPVEAAFMVYADFPTYKSGVYHRTGTGGLLGGHAVRVIGWGTENGTKYWLAANSWNSRWGDGGTFKIRRGTNECGIEEAFVAGYF